MTSRQTIGDRTRTHGMTDTRLYSVWCGIKDRCNNKNLDHYDRYGGRGITVCEEWENSFESFMDWSYSAGYDDSLTGKQQSLDRIDVNGNYCPENCRWISMKDQARNRSDTVYISDCGEMIPAREFAENHEISDFTFVFRRIKNGDSAETIIRDWNMNHNTPNDYMTAKEAADYYGVSKQSIHDWIRSGKLTAEKYGQKWFIRKGQYIEKDETRNEKGQFKKRT